MLQRTSSHHQYTFQMINLEDLVPDDHLVRKLNAAIDFSFIEKEMLHLYSDKVGRPAIHPITLFKIILLGYIFGIRSERRLVQEIQVNVAYRWFIGFDFNTPIPHHSTISQTRIRRFSKDPRLFSRIFDQIVRQAYKQGLITGKVLYTDSTHIKANANKRKFRALQVRQTPMEYVAELNECINKERKRIGKKPFDDDDKTPPTKEIKKSTVDPDAGFMTRDGKEKMFCYLDHRTVDGQHGIIVDTHLTPGNIHDARPYPSRIKRILERFHFPIKAVGLDAGYSTPFIAKVLQELKIFGVVGYKRPVHVNKELFYPRAFSYDSQQDVYVCPEGNHLKLRTINRRGYKVYKCDSSVCCQCPQKRKCTTASWKQIFRHVWQDSLDQIKGNRLLEKGKAIYQRRKETVERSFADAKELHGYRYMRFRGIERAREQAYMTSIAQNMKKIALLRG